MRELIKKLTEIKGVHNVKRKGGPVLKVNLHSREQPRKDAEKLMGDLRKISPKIRNRLEEARKNGEIKSWNWIQKPEKKYSETSIGTEKIKDRKPVGHEPSHYRISVQE
ncbi:MAG: hypothetical protein ABEJ36_00285 [Candidatus Nanosalina sp.]